MDDRSRTKALVTVGKFNPLHNGHVNIINQMIDKCSSMRLTPVICVIGGEKTTYDKPLPGSERKRMLERMFTDVQVEVYDNAFTAFESLHGRYDISGVVCGSDRIGEYEGVFSRATGQPRPNWSESIFVDRNALNHVSSSLIRESVSKGEFSKVEKYLNTLEQSIKDRIYTMY